MTEVSRKEALAKLEGFNDPLRMMILTALILKPSSAGDLATELEIPIGRVRYHLGRLRKAGLAELRESRPRRGVVERVYFIRPHFVSIVDAANLTAEEIGRGNLEILKVIMRDSFTAFRTGSFFSREEYMLARVPLRLDEEGWMEAAKVQQDALDRLLEIHGESSARLDRDAGQPISAFAVLLLFEAALSAPGKMFKKT
ncbi:MAG TPA: winged helix-turn-helix domain-containing protein [Solirubrobacterales bacterium]